MFLFVVLFDKDNKQRTITKSIWLERFPPQPRPAETLVVMFTRAGTWGGQAPPGCFPTDIYWIWVHPCPCPFFWWITEWLTADDRGWCVTAGDSVRASFLPLWARFHASAAGRCGSLSPSSLCWRAPAHTLKVSPSFTEWQAWRSEAELWLLLKAIPVADSNQTPFMTQISVSDREVRADQRLGINTSGVRMQTQNDRWFLISQKQENIIFLPKR